VRFLFAGPLALVSSFDSFVFFFFFGWRAFAMSTRGASSRGDPRAHGDDDFRGDVERRFSSLETTLARISSQLEAQQKHEQQREQREQQQREQQQREQQQREQAQQASAPSAPPPTPIRPYTKNGQGTVPVAQGMSGVGTPLANASANLGASLLLAPPSAASASAASLPFPALLSAISTGGASQTPAHVKDWLKLASDRLTGAVVDHAASSSSADREPAAYHMLGDVARAGWKAAAGGDGLAAYRALAKIIRLEGIVQSYGPDTARAYMHAWEAAQEQRREMGFAEQDFVLDFNTDLLVQSANRVARAAQAEAKQRQQQQQRERNKPTRTTQQRCSVCSAASHAEANCWTAHPETAPQDKRAIFVEKHAQWLARSKSGGDGGGAADAATVGRK
jgi:DNA-binding transcriptional MerR regulator